MDGHLVYDADCGFCTRSAHWLDRAPVAWHTLDLDAVGASADQAATSAGWLENGRITSLGSAAIAVALRARGGWTGPLGVLMQLPGFRGLAALVYPVIARNRHRLPGGTAACRLDRPV